MRTRFALLLVLGPLASTARTQSPSSLKAGDPAPAISVSWWVKGASIESFLPGRTYVVAFLDPGAQLPDAAGGSTRSGYIGMRGPSPEVASNAVDALAEAARMHPDATVMGICDRNFVPIDATELDVAGFAAWMGERANGLSLGEGRAMAGPWLKGTNQMPWAFVVRDGTILWAGSGFGVGKTLDRLAGDSASIKAAHERARAAAQAVVEATRRYVAGDAAEGAAALAKEERDFPGESTRAGYEGLRVLLAPGKEAAWTAWERELATSGRPGDRAGLLRFAMTMGQAPQVADRARQAMAIALETQPDDYATQRTATLFYRGQEDAIRERQAIDRTLALLKTLSPQDAERERAWLTRRRATLAKD